MKRGECIRMRKIGAAYHSGGGTAECKARFPAGGLTGAHLPESGRELKRENNAA